MLDKTEYYHGAAIIRMLDDERCKSVKKRGSLGYIANDEIFIFLKYTTKARSPWGFTFDQEDVDRCTTMAHEYKGVVLGLICGGDGVCALHWPEARELLESKSGRIAVKRKYDQSYTVWGTAGALKGKIPVKRWPLLLFAPDEPAQDSNNGKKNERTS
jgi:hypothetical protein